MKSVGKRPAFFVLVVVIAYVWRPADLLAGCSVLTLEQAERASPEWSFQITPYAWLAGVDGRIRPLAGGPVFDFDRSFDEVFEDLDAAFFLSAMARRERLVLLGDFAYSKSSKSVMLDNGITISGSERQRSLSLSAGWKWIDEPDLALDVLAGARFWDIEAEVEVPLLGLEAASDLSFVDPVVSARLRKDLSPRWSAILHGDVGGFGVGSDFTWQVVGTLNCRITDSLHASCGYRHLALDYRDGGRLIDLSMSGFLLGLTWAF